MSVVALGRFELSRLLRSWKFLSVTIGFPVLFYLLFLHNRRPAELVDGVVTWRVYLMVSMCSFGALVAGLNSGGTRVSYERASGWARQLRVTPLPAWSYVTTKVAAGMLVVLPVVALVEVVAVGFGGVSLGAGTLVALAALMWLTALPFAVLGMFVGFMVGTETAYAVVTVLMFVLGYFGGLFTPVDHMPQALQVAARVLPSYHHAALGLALVDGHSLAAVHWLVLAAYAVGLSVIITWRHRQEEAAGIT